ncbi:tetrapyrrole biosynthesis uroporphyrinogen III synthase [Epithele typhae]|uniref:tetrapyrrole biosynthesis uroporphyrinogen III synthase n=1 Tax=Epithele typhae TaxID=378194 RepID=UPI002007371A|nr:tetrapyrrole biosynthesis uroporphyrinogen III synthase [Epithele typhae]KAH9926598.1 tetrapyrrole biosynthesis uroporphyrinogen III synthase [Epithele typhae]
MHTRVLLLRTPPEDGSPDKYADACAAHGFHALSVPALQTVPTNAAQLATTMRPGPRPISSAGDETGFLGVIVTSGRACEAWRAAVQQLAEEDEEGRRDSVAGWSEVPFYAVSATTSASLLGIRAAYPDSPHAPRDVRRGAGAGTSEKLARFIVDDPTRRSDSPKTQRLLYLTGDKHRDTLPDILEEAGIGLESLQVYATQGSQTFEADLRAALAGMGDWTDDIWWLVHFAPSSARHVSPTLNKFFEVGKYVDTTKQHSRTAVIGPTTATCLREELGIRVDVVAAKPTADALIEGIATWHEETDF